MNISKQMNIKNLLFITLITAVSCSSCKKKSDPEPELVAGFGGDLLIVAKPEHHGNPILNTAGHPDSAMIKFNTQDLPGTDPSLFDTVLVGEEGEDHVHIEGLKPGKMFIYMAGWDTTTNERVVGGGKVNTSQKDGELIVKIAVTED